MFARQINLNAWEFVYSLEIHNKLIADVIIDKNKLIESNF